MLFAEKRSGGGYKLANGALGTVSNGAVFIKKGRMKLLPWSKQEEKACRLKHGTVLVSGPLMLMNGKECDISACNQSFVNTKHPRSAIVLTKDKKILFVVVDGRMKGKAEGVNIPELTHMIRVLGGKDALNLDGRRFFYFMERGIFRYRYH